MNGREVLLILAHLFRKQGCPVKVEEAVELLSFRWRFGTPSNVRRMLTVALQNDLISREGELLCPVFLFDRQALGPDLVGKLQDSVVVDTKFEPMH
ncbi:MAG: hypothetical protein C4K49_03415 [Candidatus Thorarchaeota archaeon]|nr:MAG: hypothetical protein C4K49_03415 [Candidatus Thorarchaeota archaeon]